MNIRKLAASLLLCNAAGIIGSIFTMPAIPAWYAALNKPAFTPPSWVFGPAWILLYTLMGVALYIVWQKKTKKAASSKLQTTSRTKAVSIFAIQLALNALWSFLFFGMRNPLYGMAGITALWLALILTIYRFWKIDKKAAYLLIPYILWVSFAAALNFAIWTQN